MFIVTEYAALTKIACMHVHVWRAVAQLVECYTGRVAQHRNTENRPDMTAKLLAVM